MHRLIRIFGLVATCMWAAGAGAQSAPDFAATDILGEWRTGARDGSWGYVRFSRCGSAYCGTLVGGGGRSVEPAYFGMRIVTDMRWSGDRFTGGRILDVERDTWYIARIRPLSRDSLRVSGCVLGGVICGAQTWTRRPD